MNILALIVFLLIGFGTDWGNAFWFLGGYGLAFIVVGYLQARGKL